GLGARRIVEVMASSASSAHRARQRAGAGRLVAASTRTPPASGKPIAPRPAAPAAPRPAVAPSRVVARAESAAHAQITPASAPGGGRAGSGRAPAPEAVMMRVRRTGPRDGAGDSSRETRRPAPQRQAAPTPGEARQAVAAENVSAAGVEGELAAIRGLLAQTLECSRRSLAAGGGGGVAGRMTDALTQQYLAMLEREVAADIADTVVGQVRDELTPA